jgi:hypothetical protein
MSHITHRDDDEGEGRLWWDLQYALPETADALSGYKKCKRILRTTQALDPTEEGLSKVQSARSAVTSRRYTLMRTLKELNDADQALTGQETSRFTLK